MKKILFIALAMCTLIANAQIRFTQVTPATDQIKIKNFGAMAVDISTYRLCALFDYTALNAAPVTIVSGDFNLSQNEVVTISWPNGGDGFGTVASDLGLYLPTGSFAISTNMVDFMQYGAAGQGRENVANTAGIWTAGTFLTGAGPWFYIGDGNSTGVTEWMSLPTNVTFRVDMQDQIVSPNGVHLAGSFQAWTPGSTAMTDANMDNVYEVTLAMNSGTYEYKFINGNDWPGQETVPMACGVDDGFFGFNRELVVGSSAIVTSLVCFSSCAACPPDPVLVSVTLSVDMNNETVSANGVHLAGDFQGWDPATTAMTDADIDGVYMATIAVEENTTIQYRFVNGNTWDDDEVVPMACGVDDGFGAYNREFVVADVDVAIDTVCFGECATCEPIVLPTYVDVTFSVDLNNQIVSANGIHVAGDFQGWDPATTAMTDADMDGVYMATIAVEENTTIQYRFVNGNTWDDDEVVPMACGVDDGFGAYNREFVVVDIDAAIDTVCFGECAACEPIVLPTYVDVTFSVDLNNQTVSANGVHVAGDFQGWDPATTAMTDADMDGVYIATIAVEENTSIQYRFVNGNTWDDDEVVPMACGVDDGFGAYNREFVVADIDAAIDTVCFGECAACEPIVLPTYVDITFQVNMQDETVSIDGVHVAGTFNDWSATAAAMTDGDADGVYTTTVQVEENTLIEFKYLNGADFGGQETVPPFCGVDDGFSGLNRIATIGAMPMMIDTVCFSGCNNCDEIIVEPSNMITLQVNMQNETVSANGVHVAGNFQGWNPATSVMTDGDADGIYTITFEADEWANLSYKFINGNDWPQAEAVPAECGLPDGNGGNNRILETGGNDVTAFVVCFGECANCEIIVEPTFVDVTFQVNMANETVSANGVHLVGNIQGWDPATSEMTDADMDDIYTITLPVEENTEALYRFVNGTTYNEDENVPMTCGEDDGFGGYNRSYEAGTVDAIVPVVCFGECADCDVIVDPTFVNITFEMNMANETVSANGVHLAGSMQGWNPATSEMLDGDMDNIYSITLEVEENTAVQYRFINGNDWPQSETVPGACGVDDGFGGMNREYTAGTTDATADTVCFGECADCDEIVEPTTVMVLFQVDMSNEAVSPNGVHVAGNFQGWNPNGTVMTDIGGGNYEIAYEVDVNTSIQFRFINGSDWPQSETVPAECGVDDGFGGMNRTLAVGEENIAYGPVCFGTCTDCEEVIEPATVEVTFLVDMNNETVDASGVHIAGNFQGWSPGTTEMLDTNSDGVYEYTTDIDTNYTVLFKFINGNDWPMQETVPLDCGLSDGFGGANRNFDIAEEDATYGPVCFASCIACLGEVPVLVTFRVDMSNETVSGDGIFIAGDFNGWDGTATQMSEYATNMYEAVVVLNAGETVQYKFLNGITYETVPGECGVGGFSNRSYTAGTNNETLAAVCFSNCIACTVVQMVDVTFLLDLGSITADINGVHIAGSFNAFSATANEMTLAFDNVYTASVTVAENTQVLFKYINGDTFTNVETVPFECGVDDGFGGYNRSITVDNVDVNLPEVCFSSCMDCPIGVVEIGSSLIEVYPNPASSTLLINAKGNYIATLNVMDVTGRIVQTIALNNAHKTQVDISALSAGLYHITNAEGKSMARLVVE